MHMTSRSEYALLAMAYLARHEFEGFVPVKVIADAQNIPPKFLEQILLALKRAHCVRSLKGKRGGYRLALKANSITLAEIIRLFDGALAPTESVSRYFYAPTPIEREDGLIRVFTKVRNFVAQTLERTTIADVI